MAIDNDDTDDELDVCTLTVALPVVRLLLLLLRPLSLLSRRPLSSRLRSLSLLLLLPLPLLAVLSLLLLLLLLSTLAILSLWDRNNPLGDGLPALP